ncbi:MAG TPA: Smr/MutS family protein [Myxococcaceae bacterium]|nr:Smr/MutS family protein [Myxococcaceae bacterium]
MGKKPAPFHNPFLGLRLKKEAPKQRQKAASAPVSAPRPSSTPRSPEEDESALFRSSVGAVAPVSKGPPLVEPAAPRLGAPRVPSEDEEVLEHLALLVGGSGEFDLADSDEFIQGSITGLDRRIVERLRAGEYAIQGHLDLHGMVRSEAKPALERFILQARRAGKRCVLVVHGRGLHSKDQIPVLKESVQVWLSRGRIAREVIAFATARPHDGGSGAVYVLLRR